MIGNLTKRSCSYNNLIDRTLVIQPIVQSMTRMIKISVGKRLRIRRNFLRKSITRNRSIKDLSRGKFPKIRSKKNRLVTHFYKMIRDSMVNYKNKRYMPLTRKRKRRRDKKFSAKTTVTLFRPSHHHQIYHSLMKLRIRPHLHL